MSHSLLFENGVVLEVTKTNLLRVLRPGRFENGVVLEVTKTLYRPGKADKIV